MTQSDSSLAPGPVFTKPDRAGRRSRLREFQGQLVERMQAARTGVDTRVNRLGVMVGDTRWLVSLQHAGEIVPVSAITPVPLTRDWFLGLTNIRGNLISVIDLARFHGGKMTTIDKDCRILSFAPGLSSHSAILVSRVMGLRNIAEMTLQAGEAEEAGEAGETAAEVDEAEAAWAAQRYVDNESQVWTGLDLSLIVQDARFLHVGL